MSSVVSSRLDYINKHPEHRSSFNEVEHELQHLKRREQVSSVVAIAGTILAMIALAGVLGAGHIVFGALVAIALLGALYAYFCRQAESSLRSRQMTELNNALTSPKLEATVDGKKEDGILGFFSTSPTQGTNPAKKASSK